MKHQLLPEKDVAELRHAAHSGAAFLPIVTESITPLELVEMIFSKIREFQSLPEKPANEVINSLGFLYGHCILLDCFWKWHLIQHDDGTFDYAIVHPEEVFYVLPRGMVWDHFKGLKHNLVLQFRMLTEFRLPESTGTWQELA